MIAPLRLIFMLLIVLTVIYIVLSLWSRSTRRRKLNDYWDRKGLTGDREAFVKRGLKQYDNSIRRKLLLGVYIVPLVVIAALIYVVNFM
ncbi:MAG: hypothetical protein ACPG61_15205 [Paracoccaceae bacterium]